jgi:hypothetical protein
MRFHPKNCMIGGKIKNFVFCRVKIMLGKAIKFFDNKLE